MKTLHNPIIIGVISSMIIGGVIFIMFQTIVSRPESTPDHTTWKIYQITPNLKELNVSEIIIQNQTYYFDTLNDTAIEYHHDPVQILFHDVVFTLFPWPFSGGPVGSCGGNGFGADAKFPDGIHELINIFVASQPCLGDSTPTKISTHINPQAGLVFYDGKMRLLVSTQNEFTAAPPRSNQTTHYYIDSIVKPKVELYDYYYDGIGKDNGTVSINNKTYYQTTLNYVDYDLKKGTSIQIQNVTFAFPEGVMNTPGGSFIMLDVKFPDGSEEIYGENKKNPDGSGVLGGIEIPTQYGPHLATNSTTVLGNHTMPQAGITIYNDKIKLLVSKLPQLSQQLATECTAGPGMSCNNPPAIIPQNNGANLVTQDDLDRIHTLCNNPIISANGSDTLITCPIPANVTSWIDISSPIYKITPCRSTYGCSGLNVYIQQNQDTMISEKQKEELENFVLKEIPEAKSWPNGWKLDNVEIQVRPNGVNAYMQFFLPVINPTYKNCGWYPQVSIDLERKVIIQKENLIPESNVPCTQ